MRPPSHRWRRCSGGGDGGGDGIGDGGGDGDACATAAQLNGKGCKAAGQSVVAVRRLLDVNNDGVVNKDDLMHVAGKTSWLWRTSVRNCQRIDQICRLVFPPLYIFFVLVMGSTLVKDSYRE